MLSLSAPPFRIIDSTTANISEPRLFYASSGTSWIRGSHDDDSKWVGMSSVNILRRLSRREKNAERRGLNDECSDGANCQLFCRENSCEYGTTSQQLEKKIPTHIVYSCMRRCGLLRAEPLTRAQHTLSDFLSVSRDSGDTVNDHR